jgi:hypothetical protein
MATKTEYWLVTTKQRYCSGYQTFAINTHPAAYMAKCAEESLIFAMPITRKQFLAVRMAYCEN